MNKLMGERDREKERECAHAGVYVCVWERDNREKEDFNTGHNVQVFFFFFFVPQAAKEAKVPPRCSAQPHTPTSFKSLQPTDLQNTQIYITMWPLRALNHRELHAVVRKKTNPTTSLVEAYASTWILVKLIPLSTYNLTTTLKRSGLK